MKHLYVPWRKKYADSKGCPFCEHLAQKNDAKNFVVKRYNNCAVFLNLHPYNVGHLLVIPYKHTGKLEELDAAVRAELMEVTMAASSILSEEMKCGGINIGFNLGNGCAGGSIPDHLHVHVVPRYEGDTNFLPIISDTRLIVRDLNELYAQLYKAFARI